MHVSFSNLSPSVLLCEEMCLVLDTLFNKLAIRTQQEENILMNYKLISSESIGLPLDLYSVSRVVAYLKHQGTPEEDLVQILLHSLELYESMHIPDIVVLQHHSLKFLLFLSSFFVSFSIISETFDIQANDFTKLLIHSNDIPSSISRKAIENLMEALKTNFECEKSSKLNITYTTNNHYYDDNKVLEKTSLNKNNGVCPKETPPTNTTLEPKSTPTSTNTSSASQALSPASDPQLLSITNDRTSSPSGSSNNETNSKLAELSYSPTPFTSSEPATFPSAPQMPIGSALSALAVLLVTQRTFELSQLHPYSPLTSTSPNNSSLVRKSISVPFNVTFDLEGGNAVPNAYSCGQHLKYRVRRSSPCPSPRNKNTTSIPIMHYPHYINAITAASTAAHSGIAQHQASTVFTSPSHFPYHFSPPTSSTIRRQELLGVASSIGAAGGDLLYFNNEEDGSDALLKDEFFSTLGTHDCLFKKMDCGRNLNGGVENVPQLIQELNTPCYDGDNTMINSALDVENNLNCSRNTTNIKNTGRNINFSNEGIYSSPFERSDSVITTFQSCNATSSSSTSKFIFSDYLPDCVLQDDLSSLNKLRNVNNSNQKIWDETQYAHSIDNLLLPIPQSSFTQSSASITAVNYNSNNYDNNNINTKNNNNNNNNNTSNMKVINCQHRHRQSERHIKEELMKPPMKKSTQSDPCILINTNAINKLKYTSPATIKNTAYTFSSSSNPICNPDTSFAMRLSSPGSPFASSHLNFNSSSHQTDVDTTELRRNFCFQPIVHQLLTPSPPSSPIQPSQSLPSSSLELLANNNFRVRPVILTTNHTSMGSERLSAALSTSDSEIPLWASPTSQMSATGPLLSSQNVFNISHANEDNYLSTLVKSVSLPQPCQWMVPQFGTEEENSSDYEYV